MKKKILMTILGVLLILSAGVLFAFAADFTDLPKEHWAYENVEKLVDTGAVTGYPDGTFKPDENVTREQFAKVLVETLELNSETQNVKYEDVEDSRWSKEYINKASKYLTSYKINNKYYFRPENNAVREDMAVAVVKARGLDNCEPNYSLLEQFSDANSISFELRKYIAIAVEYGIMQGCGNGQFNPQATLTRAEMVTLLCNVSEKVVVDDILSKIPVLEYNKEEGFIDLGKDWEQYEYSYSDTKDMVNWNKPLQQKLYYQEEPVVGKEFNGNWFNYRIAGTEEYRTIYISNEDKLSLINVTVGEQVLQRDTKNVLKENDEIVVNTIPNVKYIKYRINKLLPIILKTSTVKIPVPKLLKTFDLEITVETKNGNKVTQTYNCEIGKVEENVVMDVTSGDKTLVVDENNIVIRDGEIVVKAQPNIKYISYKIDKIYIKTVKESTMTIPVPKLLKTFALTIITETENGNKLTQTYNCEVKNIEEDISINVTSGDKTLIPNEKNDLIKDGKIVIKSEPSAKYITYQIDKLIPIILKTSEATIPVPKLLKTFDLKVTVETENGNKVAQTYSCEVKNVEEDVKISVVSGDKTLIPNEKNDLIKDGKIVIKSEPSAKYITYQIDKLIPIILKISEATIPVPKLLKTFDLKVTVETENGNKVAQTFSCEVKTEAPDISVILNSKLLEEGGTYSLSEDDKLSISSQPKAEYIRYRIDNRNTVSVRDSSTLVKIPSDLDKFVLTVFAETKDGNMSIEEYNFTVKRKVIEPIIKVLSENTVFEEDGRYKLQSGDSIIISASPDIDYIQYKINDNDAKIIKEAKTIINIMDDAKECVLKVIAKTKAGVTSNEKKYYIDVIDVPLSITDVSYNASKNNVTINVDGLKGHAGTISYNIYNSENSIIERGTYDMKAGSNNCVISLDGKPVPAIYEFSIKDNTNGKEATSNKETFKPELRICMYKQLLDRTIKVNSSYVSNINSQAVTKERRNNTQVNSKIEDYNYSNGKLSFTVDYEAGTELIVKDNRGNLKVSIVANGFKLEYNYRMVHTLTGELTGEYRIQTIQSNI